MDKFKQMTEWAENGKDLYTIHKETGSVIFRERTTPKVRARREWLKDTPSNTTTREELKQREVEFEKAYQPLIAEVKSAVDLARESGYSGC